MKSRIQVFAMEEVGKSVEHDTIPWRMIWNWNGAWRFYCGYRVVHRHSAVQPVGTISSRT